MKDLVKPTIGSEPYDPTECVRIADRYQMFLYVKHGVYPVDMYVNGDDMVMVFYKKDTKELYELWRQHRLS